jgi:hypothetical protein
VKPRGQPRNEDVSYSVQPVEGGLVSPLPAGECRAVIADPDAHRTRPLGNWQSDDAVDLAATPGTSVLAVERSTVVKVDRTRERARAGFVYGAAVTLAGDSGTWWFYTHLVLRPSLAPADRLEQGEAFAAVAPWDDFPDAAHVHVGAGQGRGRSGSPERALQLTRTRGRPYHRGMEPSPASTGAAFREPR